MKSIVPDNAQPHGFHGPHLLFDRLGFSSKCCGLPAGCAWCAMELANAQKAYMDAKNERSTHGYKASLAKLNELRSKR